MTEREYRTAIRGLPVFRKILIICLLMLPLGLYSLTTSKPELTPLLVGVGLPVFLELVAVRWACRKNARLIAGPWTVRVTGDGFSLHTSVSQADLSWNLYREARERSDFWYLRQTTGVTSFIPKRAFDDAQRAELAAFFADRLPAIKRPWYRFMF